MQNSTQSWNVFLKQKTQPIRTADLTCRSVTRETSKFIAWQMIVSGARGRVHFGVTSVQIGLNTATYASKAGYKSRNTFTVSNTKRCCRKRQSLIVIFAVYRISTIRSTKKTTGKATSIDWLRKINKAVNRYSLTAIFSPENTVL